MASDTPTASCSSPIRWMGTALMEANWANWGQQPITPFLRRAGQRPRAAGRVFDALRDGG